MRKNERVMKSLEEVLGIDFKEVMNDKDRLFQSTTALSKNLGIPEADLIKLLEEHKAPGIDTSNGGAWFTTPRAIKDYLATQKGPQPK